MTTLAVLLTDSSLATELLIGLVGSAGVTGALIAFLKLPGDKTTAAVSQAQGANEILQATLDEVIRERDYWRDRYQACAVQMTQLVHELGLRDRLDD